MTARLYPKVGTFFQVRVRDSVGCEQYKSFFLKVVRKNEIIVPTGFSPNNDGENDNLSVFGTKGTKVIKFEIFDKWGEEVFNLSDFQVNDAYVGWDGNFNGISMPSGVYIWKCTVKFPDGSVRKEKGLVTLLR
jgi:gliding motility-associated-like protein